LRPPRARLPADRTFHRLPAGEGVKGKRPGPHHLGFGHRRFLGLGLRLPTARWEYGPGGPTFLRRLRRTLFFSGVRCANYVLRAAIGYCSSRSETRFPRFPRCPRRA
jgi:hypothetical protein